MNSVLQFSRSLEPTDCAVCGATFAVAPHFLASRRADKAGFYCPNGHQLSFNESEADRLKKKLEQAARDLAAKESALQTQRSRAERAEQLEVKAHAKLKRVKNGVCPCCNRSFVALQRHIKTKHPGWKP